MIALRWIVFTRTGRVLALIAALVAVGMAWRAYERRDAVADERAAQAARDRAAIERRDQTLDTITGEDDDTLIDRLAGPR